MSKYVKVFLTAAVALVALVAVAGTAAASEAVVSPAGSISSPSSGKLSFTGGIFTIQCEITLNGSLRSGPIRTEGTEQIGEVAEVTINREGCSGGSVSGVLFAEGNWSITLTRTLGTAPNEVTGLLFTIHNAQFRLSVFGEAINCLYKGNQGALMEAVPTRTAGVYTTGSISALATRLPLFEGGGLCPSTGSMRGNFGITRQTVTVS